LASATFNYAVLLQNFYLRAVFFLVRVKEPNTDHDEEYKKKVNDLLNNPPAPSSRSGTLGTDWNTGIEGQLRLNM
jgi:hypothetical protein